MGGQMVGVSKYGYVETQCEKPGMGEAKGETSIVSYPKEVFGWYVSASMHTAKRSIPKQVYVLAACAVAFVAAVAGAVHYVGNISDPDKIEKSLGVSATAQDGQEGSFQRTAAPDQPRTPEQFVAAYTPRVDGLAHTAPAYDTITQPTRAPLPAACISSKSQGCKCYTQDATPYPTTPDICAQVVAGGWFNDFAEPGQSQRKPESSAVTLKATGAP
jgi:zona occludens toxin